ncbi:BolA/IbaG family iron-sulfur metabolism protein [Gammaproteobacteria bacterium]|nr:BolA/IbaG family iron-sulfur metabolism protein [Gammaproteobacteria bacterium]
MEASTIQGLLVAALPTTEIDVQGEGGKYLVTATGSIFEGLNAVKRQQTIYKVLNEYISSGAIHAVTMRLSAPGEA